MTAVCSNTVAGTVRELPTRVVETRVEALADGDCASADGGVRECEGWFDGHVWLPKGDDDDCELTAEVGGFVGVDERSCDCWWSMVWCFWLHTLHALEEQFLSRWEEEKQLMQRFFFLTCSKRWATDNFWNTSHLKGEWDGFEQNGHAPADGLTVVTVWTVFILDFCDRNDSGLAGSNERDFDGGSDCSTVR